MRARILIAVSLMSSLVWTRKGRAEDAAAAAPHVARRPDAYTIGPEPAWYLLGGWTTGSTLVAHDHGYYLGGEASIVRLSPKDRFVGFYGDGYHDFGARRTYTTAGLEGGAHFVGVDGGLATRFGGDRPEWGAAARLFASVGVVGLYVRYAYFAASLGRSDDHVVQIGALIKVPAWIWGLE